MKKVIEVKNLCKNFGSGNNITKVLKDITFDVEDGQFLSIMGPSGCGKSTLLYLMGGLDAPTSGEILINDRDIQKLKDREISKIQRSDIGFVFQFYNLVHNLSVEENILLPIAMSGQRVKKYHKKLDEILDIVGLSDKRKDIPSHLSGGQQQRVAIARAVITNPSIILADEPIGNLDSKSGERIMELFRDINCEYGITIIQVTHDESKTLYGNRLIRLYDGIIIEDKVVAN
ncbi:ABC transporter ATP-binding protein [Clostridium sp. D2Q-14]|uniref:ABC transporter ATP-binding protein n=1 Tax=Anaeromonas gelatinilytica TaxID=2683194 RepID=UPI00193B4E59|nr:ABC transporter ATP-binding protein [Anaeromonas gelatinilytica]MBS4535927.1 ABC transporter ATP-binding protein [Anaeromonas gelatinilytica]